VDVTNHIDERRKSSMRTLIVEDDFTSRLLLQKLLEPYGECHITVNGREAVDAFRLARREGRSYDLICLDIMMPEMDGQTVLKEIRALEKDAGIPEGDGVKILMTTALKDGKNVMTAFRELCDAYLTKPIDRAKLLESLRKVVLVR
jgi:two-component system chemotaxis response regulator CheY